MSNLGKRIAREIIESSDPSECEKIAGAFNALAETTVIHQASFVYALTKALAACIAGSPSPKDIRACVIALLDDAMDDDA